MDYAQQLRSKIEELRHRIIVSENTKKEYEKLQLYIEEGEQLKAEIEAEHYSLDSTSKFLSKYRVNRRVMDSNQITNTITSIVNLVFPEYDYTYYLDGKLNGDYTHTELLYKDSQGYSYVPSISNGNGIQQLVSVSCGTVITALSDTTPTLLLDEKLKSVSPDRAGIVGEVLQQFTEYGFQFLLIEHTPELFENIDYTEVLLTNHNRETKLEAIYKVNNRQEFSEEFTE